MYDFDFDDIDSETPNFDFCDEQSPEYQREATIEELLQEASEFDTDFYGDEVAITEDDYSDLLDDYNINIVEDVDYSDLETLTDFDWN
jgi:hypothetical protein